MKYINELKKLKLPLKEYAIFGSGPLAVRNLRDNEDIDLIVSQELWNELIRKYKPGSKGQITIQHVEIWREWYNMPINELIQNSELINNLPFVKLECVIHWKTKRGMDKDKKDIKLINDYLLNEKKLNSEVNAKD